MFGCIVFRGGLMAEPNAKKLVDLGRNSYSKQDFTQAKKYFEKACDLKDGVGCFNLGVLYDNGHGVGKDLKKAAQLYFKACELNDGSGCFNAGNIYRRGDGVAKNFKEALARYSKACELNDGDGCSA
ncbi:beta-lactamase HcpA domain protein [Helicobacter pylori GAM112Ai]|nr:beta-lactamase HcpA domain protein [Helicobacter pylori GAM112Ai]EMH33705.1 beta-lactamase HcpA domain protein [Helicobacter pylori GAM42Ai]